MLYNYANSTTQPTYLVINSDIDCNGNTYNFKDWSSSGKNLIVEGNGHTIYNFHASRASSVSKHGIFGSITNGFTMKNLFFSNCYIEAGSCVGIVGHTDQGITTLENVGMNECYIRALNPGDSGGKAALAGMPMTIDSPTNTIGGQSSFRSVYAKNSTIVGDMHIGSVAGFYAYVDFTDCYAENNMVISTGGHAGAFAGCTNESSHYLRCWSNSTIYGNAQVGGFTSGFDGRGSVYEDCFASGVVEGETEIGGFCGFTNFYRWNGYPGKSIYKNCYSTCMVGMNYHSAKAGSFIGYVPATAMSASFENCYASGEVGSIDTDMATTTDCGGFVGIHESGADAVYSSCYYDMQTTAMKNKAVGSASLLSMSRDATGVSTASWNGIKGVTTKKMTGNSSIFPSGYIYTPGLYPQLSAMTGHADVKFRAQSAASAATVFCDDWSDISATGFDTVRDTMRNYSFSSSEPFGSNAQFAAAHVDSPNISDVTWGKDGNISPVDRTSPVITLAEKPYYTTSLSPGIEWVEVSLKYTDGSKSATGNRRLRLIPTSVIETGGDKRVDVFYDGDNNETTPYDHKEGFATTYLDAKTLQTYLESSTSHPEALKTFEQVTSQQYANGVISGTMELPFNSSVKNLAVTASMTRQDGSPASIENLFDKLNGTKRFESQDCGMYRIAYKASLADGRYLSIGKKLIVVGPWSVVYNYNYDGLLEGEKISPDSIFHVQSNLMDFVGFDFEAYGEPPARDGWTFSYWSLDKEGKQPVDQAWFDSYEDRYGTLNRNIDVYAQYNRLAPTTVVSVSIDPRSGTYEGKPTGEKTVAEGTPGDKILLDAAIPPERFLFEGWGDGTLGGGTLDYFEEAGKWVFTFGDEDANIPAMYKQNVFDLYIRRINKYTGAEIVEAATSPIAADDAFSLRTDDSVDSLLYNVPAAEVKVYDADTGEGLQWNDVSLTRSETDVAALSGTMPARNIRIDIVYDTWIQMPATGSSETLVLIGIGAIVILVVLLSKTRDVHCI